MLSYSCHKHYHKCFVHDNNLFLFISVILVIAAQRNINISTSTLEAAETSTEINDVNTFDEKSQQLLHFLAFLRIRGWFHETTKNILNFFINAKMLVFVKHNFFSTIQTLEFMQTDAAE